MEAQKLFVVLLGCTPSDRNIEQHDVFIGVGESLEALAPQLKAFWPVENLHIDAYWIVEHVDGYRIEISKNTREDRSVELYFVNLGGYIAGEFEEFHKKLLVVAPNVPAASRKAKEDPFFKAGAQLPDRLVSHIDDRYTVDEVINLSERLPGHSIALREDSSGTPSAPTIGYITFEKLLRVK